jgi:hypothetical protein
MKLFRPLLASFINPHHELIHLGNQLDWQGLGSHFAPLYSATGTTSKPIRLMVGLLIITQLYNLSDEKVVETWLQNPYEQYFTGEIFFSWQPPCDASDLVHFRHRIGQEGVQKIFEQKRLLRFVPYPSGWKVNYLKISDLVSHAKNILIISKVFLYFRKSLPK